MTDRSLTFWVTAAGGTVKLDALLPAQPGLTSNVTWLERASHDQDGIVQSQKPAPGTRRPYGSVVDLQVGFAY